jgi:hypothetical protein
VILLPACEFTVKPKEKMDEEEEEEKMKERRRRRRRRNILFTL